MSSWNLTGVVVVAIVCSYGFTWLTRLIAPKFKLIDQPDGQRKLQTRPVALGGGVAVYAALLSTLLVVSVAAANLPWARVSSAKYLPALVGAGLLCLMGLWDDRRPMRSWTKLWLQIACCLPFLAFGQSIGVVSLFGFDIHLGWASRPLTLVWLVACINAFNLIDGLDGLASTFGIIATSTLGALALMSGNDAIAMLSFVIAGALVGFLIHNWPPARIYLGDAGSCCLGYLIGAISMQASHKTTTAYLMAVPLALLAIPLFDTLMAILRRKLTGRHIAVADREHIHHCLQDRGLSNRQVLLALTSLSILLALSAVATCMFQNDMIAIATSAITLLALVACRVFGHRETTMLIAHVKMISALRWKRQATTAVEKLDSRRDEIGNGLSEPVIIKLPAVDLSTTMPDSERENRAA